MTVSNEIINIFMIPVLITILLGIIATLPPVKRWWREMQKRNTENIKNDIRAMSEEDREKLREWMKRKNMNDDEIEEYFSE